MSAYNLHLRRPLQVYAGEEVLFAEMLNRKDKWYYWNCSHETFFPHRCKEGEPEWRMPETWATWHGNNTPPARRLLQIDMDAYAFLLRPDFLQPEKLKAHHNTTSPVSEAETGIALTTLISFILLIYLLILVRGLREQFARPKRSSVASRETDTLWNVLL